MWKRSHHVSSRHVISYLYLIVPFSGWHIRRVWSSRGLYFAETQSSQNTHDEAKRAKKHFVLHVNLPVEHLYPNFKNHQESRVRAKRSPLPPPPPPPHTHRYPKSEGARTPMFVSKFQVCVKFIFSPQRFWH